MQKRRSQHSDDWNRIRQQPKWSAGLTEFRYGLVSISRGAKDKHSRSVDVRSRITLAGQMPPPPIFNRDKRKHVIHTLFDAMKDWRFSPFQHEGATRNHLRSVLCAAGYGWDRSDAEAAFLVAEVLRGYPRPSWSEGQPSYTASVVTCRGCGGPLDDYEVSNGIRYCCIECERISRNKSTGLSQGFVDLGPTTCENPECEKVFFPKEAFSKYCCRECYQVGRGLNLPLKNCLTCDKDFHPDQKSQIFCSRRCREISDFAKGKERRHAARLEVRCEGCNKFFVQTRTDKKCCSPTCAKRASRARQAAMTDPASPVGKLFDQAA